MPRPAGFELGWLQNQRWETLAENHCICWMDVNLHTRSNTNMDAWQRGLFKAVSSHLLWLFLAQVIWLSTVGGGASSTTVHCAIKTMGLSSLMTSCFVHLMMQGLWIEKDYDMVILEHLFRLAPCHRSLLQVSVWLEICSGPPAQATTQKRQSKSFLL